MSKTMTQTQKTLTEMAESIHLKDTFTLQINNQFLNHNFYMIKQCLLKVQQLQTEMGKQKNGNQQFQRRFQQMSNKVKQNQKMTVSQDTKIKELQNNIGDDFMKKLYDIQTRIKNTYDFDQTVRRLENLNKFVATDNFQLQKKNVDSIGQQFQKLKNDMNRYVQHSQLNIYKQQMEKELQNINTKIDGLNIGAQMLDNRVGQINLKCQGAANDVKQTNIMIKEINFTQLLDKIKKFKQDTDHKVGELSLKMKKKVGTNDLSELQKGIIEKLDKFFFITEKGKASVNQTKDALMYLQKRVNEIIEIFISKEEDQDKDALFSTKKIQCASCTKDMGKFQGKLGNFRPWAVFPCKQLQPEKTGGYGYLSYIQKLTSRRGSSSIDQNNLQRLSKTFNNNQRNDEQSPHKLNSTRTTNFISNYGSQQKQVISLKDEYFKDLKVADKSQKSGAKFFRVKKDPVKPSTAMEMTKQKVKQI